MLPDRVSNPEPLTYKSGVLPIAPRGPANSDGNNVVLLKLSPTERGGKNKNCSVAFSESVA